MTEDQNFQNQPEEQVIAYDTLSLANNLLPNPIGPAIPILLGRIQPEYTTRVILENARMISEAMQTVEPDQRLGLSMGFHLCLPTIEQLEQNSLYAHSLDFPFPVEDFWTKEGPERLKGSIKTLNYSQFLSLIKSTMYALANPDTYQAASNHVLQTAELLKKSEKPIILRISSCYGLDNKLLTLVANTIKDLNQRLPDRRVIVAIEPDGTIETFEKYSNQIIQLPGILSRFGAKIETVKMSADVAHIKEIGEDPFILLHNIITSGDESLIPLLVEWDTFGINSDGGISTHLSLLGSEICNVSQLRDLLQLAHKHKQNPGIVIETSPQSLKIDMRDIPKFMKELKRN